MTPLLRLLTWLVLLGQIAVAQSPELFFLAIGSDTYATAKPGVTFGFQSLRSVAGRSAMRVSDLLTQGGARFGITLVSTDDKLVTTGDIQSALSRLHEKVSASGAKQPVAVFYFAGHGISEGLAWNHFSIPGNFLSRKDPSDLHVEDLEMSTLHASALVDELETWKIPFIVLLDTCSEGRGEDFRYSVLSQQAQESLRGVRAVLRFQNEFHGNNPVIFAAEPGKVVSTVANPRSPRQASLGPLARRVTLLLDPAFAQHRAVSVAAFVQALTASGFDKETQPGITHAELPKFASSALLNATAVPVKVEERNASGIKPEICCGEGKRSVGPAKGPQAAIGRIRIEGAPGEFVTDGKRFTFASPPAKFVLAGAEEGRLAVEIDSVEGEPWNVGFSTPGGKRFTIGRYLGATRLDLGVSGTPGIEVSGNAHGCNEIAGQFTVTSVVYGPDGALQQFAATFQQLCDDNRIAHWFH